MKRHMVAVAMAVQWLFEQQEHYYPPHSLEVAIRYFEGD